MKTVDDHYLYAELLMLLYFEYVKIVYRLYFIVLYNLLLCQYLSCVLISEVDMALSIPASLIWLCWFSKTHFTLLLFLLSQ